MYIVTQTEVCSLGQPLERQMLIRSDRAQHQLLKPYIKVKHAGWCVARPHVSHDVLSSNIIFLGIGETSWSQQAKFSMNTAKMPINL